MKVAENVHIIKTPYRGIFTAMYLITGKSLTLIDSGQPTSWNGEILPYLRRLNRDPEDLSLIVHTHSHGDHVGSDRQIREATGAEIAIHEIGARFLEDPESQTQWRLKRFGEYLSEAEREAIQQRQPREPLTVDRRLEDGEVIDAGPLRLRVVHTPGHSPDSVCLYDGERRMLFTGDSVQGEGTVIDDLIIVQDVDAIVASMRRLEQMDIDLLLSDHPYRPFESAVLDGERAGKFIKATIDLNKRIAAKILETLGSAGKPMTTPEVSGVICSAFGRSIPEGRSNGTVLAHLIKQAEEGRVTFLERGGRALWALRGKG